MPPDIVVVPDFKIMDTCFDEFWSNETPWNYGSPIYNSYMPVCNCVMIATDCYNYVIGMFIPMYKIAKVSILVSSNEEEENNEDAFVFASNFIPKDCLNFALSYTTMMMETSDEDEDDPPSND